MSLKSIQRHVMGIEGIISPPNLPDLVALFGSGEISASGRRVYEWLLSKLSPPIRVAILETPAGFQPNSAQVAQDISDFLRYHLQNYQLNIDIVPARRREAHFSTEDESVVSPVLLSSMIFLGPGSPTYAVRQLQESLAWHTVLACHRQGATLVLASAATIASGVKSLPVYEIYKAGEDLHWRPGLDLFGPYGLSLVFISHWNNNEGGDKLDTSRCYMGQSRFAHLVKMLPPDVNIIGIDEHTALLVDLIEQNCRVMGRGTVTLLRDGKEDSYSDGQIFAISELGPFHTIEQQSGITLDIWERVKGARAKAREVPFMQPSADVLTLVESREKARACGDWKMSDALREQILISGWKVNDTRNGPQLIPREQ